MKSIPILLALILVPMLGNAQQHGCYTTNGYDCFAGGVACNMNYDLDYFYYGETIARMCSDLSFLYQEGEKLFNKTRKDKSTISKQKKLIARLKSACGSRCRNIK